MVAVTEVCYAQNPLKQIFMEICIILEILSIISKRIINVLR